MGFSKKQRKILQFPYTEKYALICDGAIRSGKTSIMSIAFILWAMSSHNNRNFAFCGKSVGSVERNVINPLLSVAYIKDNFDVKYNRSLHMLEIKRGKTKNTFYLFGGKDESSYTLIQGITLAGAMLDEVVLMPRSFVEQAIGRCSVEGSRLWFNCNPGVPSHWFREEWILKANEKAAKYIHFLMEDNPSLSKETIKRYKSMYQGTFYQRYILGEWVASEGRIYDMFDKNKNTYTEQPIDLYDCSTRTICCDYGTTNPCVFLDVYDDGEHIYINNEYRWDSRKKQRQKTDEEYADDMEKFVDGRYCNIIVDPSSASFIAALKNRGLYVIPAKNNVLDGIRKTSVLLQTQILQINEQCTGLLMEIESYIWDEKAAAHGEEKPLKENDHSMDALRYFVNSLENWRFE